MKIKKIVVTGASTYGVENMGDDAMFANLVQGIRSYDSKIEIVFIARHLDEKFDKLFKVSSIKNLDHGSNKFAEGRMFYGFNKGDKDDHLSIIKNEILDADLFIIGGNSLMEISENTFLRGVSSYATSLAVLSKFCGTPYSLFGLNIVDPIKSLTSKQHARFLIENSSVVTVREHQVVEYLKNEDIDVTNVKVMGDPALGMIQELDNEIAYEILKNNNINLVKNMKIISVSFRFEYWKYKEKDNLKFAKKLAKIIDSISSKFNFQILFIPNCTYTMGHKWEDDRLVHHQIINRLKTKCPVHSINARLNLFETYSLYSLTDFHISNRRHSYTFAAMNSKPFLALSVSLSTHISALVKALDVEDLYISINEKQKNIISKIIFILDNQDRFVNKINNGVKRLSKISRRNVKYILDNFK